MSDIGAVASLQVLLGHLRLLFPVTGVLHVGAGRDIASAPYASWDVARALLVEAQEDMVTELSRAAEDRAGWQVASALVGDREGEIDFHVASNARESGVLAPDRLTHLWRNLQLRELRSLRSTRLETLLNDPRYPSSTFNWVLVDCLPALPVLQGAGSFLEGWDVIVVRGVLTDEALGGTGATKDESEAFLSGRGFRCLAWEEERQPVLAQIVYVRDSKAALESRTRQLRAEYEAQVLSVRTESGNRSMIQASVIAKVQGEFDRALQSHAELVANLQSESAALESQKAALESQLAAKVAEFEQVRELGDQARSELVKVEKEHLERMEGLQGEVDRLQAVAAERDEHARVSSERLERIDQLTRDHDGHARVSRERLAHIEKLIRDGEEHARVSKEHQARIEQLTRDHDEHARVSRERLAHIEKLIRDGDEHVRVSKEHQARIEQLTRDHDEHARVSRERLGQIEKLIRDGEAHAKRVAEMEKDRAELDVRQHRLDEELAKAEAQIDLITNVVLREKAF